MLRRTGLTGPRSILRLASGASATSEGATSLSSSAGSCCAPACHYARRLSGTAQVLIWVQLRRIGRQVEHFNLVLMILEPGLDHLGMVHLEIVQDQEDFPLGITDQALHEVDQDRHIHGAVEKPEPHLPLVGDSGDEIDRRSSRIETEDRRGTCLLYTSPSPRD